MPHAVTEEAALRAVSLTGFVSCGVQSRVTLSKNLTSLKETTQAPCHANAMPKARRLCSSPIQYMNMQHTIMTTQQRVTEVSA